MGLKSYIQKLRDRVQKRVDAFLLRKAKEEARKRVTDFLKPPDVKMENEEETGRPKKKRAAVDYPFICLAEHFSIDFMGGFIQLVNNLLHEETEVGYTKNKEKE